MEIEFRLCCLCNLYYTGTIIIKGKIYCIMCAEYRVDKNGQVKKN